MRKTTRKIGLEMESSRPFTITPVHGAPAGYLVVNIESLREVVGPDLEGRSPLAPKGEPKGRFSRQKDVDDNFFNQPALRLLADRTWPGRLVWEIVRNPLPSPTRRNGSGGKVP